jgi:hypothetical protein
MKHLMTFESFVSNDTEHVDEGSIRKFFTGFETKADEKAAEDKFMKALSDAEAAMKKDPKDYAQSEKWEVNKAFLLGKASENKFRGGLRVQRGGGGDDRYYIVYDPKGTGFEALAAASGGEVRLKA